MEAGILEKVLTRRYGKPITSILDGMGARVWNPDDDDYEAVLYMGMKWRGIFQTRFHSLRAIYGNSCGGYLMKNSLKAAILLPRRIYGVWNIDDLRMQPEVQYAGARDPDIDYFMEAYNVYFYGIKAGHLYVFDAETDELDPLGPVEHALETVMDEYESAKAEIPDEEGMS